MGKKLFEEVRNMSAIKATRAPKMFLCLSRILILAVSFSAGFQVNAAGDSKKILPERERARITDEWLKWRLENILLCPRGEQENDCAAGNDAR
jgi:hypothetical protein